MRANRLLSGAGRGRASGICTGLLAMGLFSGCIATIPARTLHSLRTDGAPCYDRERESETAIVDTHVHFRPFGGAAIPFPEVLSYFDRTGVLFANIYGIGQALPPASDCTYYLHCPGTPTLPSLKNDIVNAVNFHAHGREHVHLTLSMTFPDLSRPETVVAGMRLLDREFPGAFGWMGEVNLVKQALFRNAHEPVSASVLGGWAGFMQELRERDMPLAVHADLGSDQEPTLYLALIEEMLRLYPDNTVIWMHMGLSKELVSMDPAEHIGIVRSLLDRYPKLMVDISWRVIHDNYFTEAEARTRYVDFLNSYSSRVLPGTDFVASADKDFNTYRTELEVTSDILGDLDDTAFHNIALGQNYFRLLDLDYTAPEVCSDSD